MGTRGFITFVADGQEKTQYNQFDSYPEGVGVAVLHFLHEALMPPAGDLESASLVSVHEVMRAELLAAVRALRVVTEETPITVADLEALERWTDMGVGRKVKPEVLEALRAGEKVPAHEHGMPQWYQLVRRAQGDPSEILCCGVILHDPTFPQDSLWAEWGYVIDLDDGDLEVYLGFQTARHDVGRFADRDPVTDGYFPVRRIAAWPLDELPTHDEFVAACNRIAYPDEDGE